MVAAVFFNFFLRDVRFDVCCPNEISGTNGRFDDQSQNQLPALSD